MRVALFITEDWYARSHRLPLIRAAAAQGNEVLLLTHVDRYRRELEEAGATVVGLPLNRSGKNPVSEARLISTISSVLRRFNPHVLHNVALKPVLYGSAAARIARVPVVINAMAGLGSLFIEGTGRSRQALVPALVRVLRSRDSWVVVQNPDDEAVVRSFGVSSDRTVLIRGAGVDTASFAPVPEPAGPSVVVRFFGRLLLGKGVRELFEAASSLRSAGSPVKIELAGDRDVHNPECISLETVEKWTRSGAVSFLGHVDDVRPLMAEANIIVLPSYREGLPKALIEGAAMGRALVATDVPGCREVVQHEKNGLLVPPRDAQALAGALDRLASQPELRARMGSASRRLAVDEFDVSSVISRTLDLYARAVAG